MKLKYLITRILTYLQPKTVIHTSIAKLDINNLLEGRFALITGGTSGIGFSIAEAFLRSGAKVVITGRSEKKLTAAIKDLSVYGECAGLVMDVTDISHLEDKFDGAIAKFGKIDILVNNAGISGGHISNTTEEEFDSVLRTNLKGVFFLSRIAGKYMVKNNIQGNILNISSASSVRPAACAYTISKWGVRGFTMGLARTLLPYNIIVNSLAPGPVATPLLGKNNECEDISFPVTPSRRYALPCEVANLAVILVSEMGRLIVGDTVFMTGGAGNINNGDMEYPFV